MKLSFIMQTYLGDYPGSRSNPVEKFKRAVNSLINQTNPNWELIIVSDGCELARNVYDSDFYHIPNIKFAYVDKDENTKMYAENNGQKYYRGLPREIGRSLATGDWIGYMDSDDFLMDYTVNRLISSFNQVKDFNVKNNKNINIVLNTLQIENIIFAAIVRAQREKHGPNTMGVSTMESMPFEIEGLPSEWFVSGFAGGSSGQGSVVIWHKNDINQSWEDVVSIGDISEDMKFVTSAVAGPENATIKIKVPYYVRCHHSKLWDY